MRRSWVRPPCVSLRKRMTRSALTSRTFFTKSAEKPRRSGRGWIGVGRAGLNAQEPNKTHAVPEPSMGEGTAEVEAPAFMPGRMSPQRHRQKTLETLVE